MAKGLSAQKQVLDWMNLEQPELRGQEPAPWLPQSWFQPTQLEVREIAGEEYIAWTYDPPEAWSDPVEGKDQEWFCQMLLAFVALGYEKAVDAQAVKVFAERYGPLGIEVLVGADSAELTPDPKHEGIIIGCWYYEKIGAWKKYAGIARAILTLASYLSKPEISDHARKFTRLHYAAGSRTCSQDLECQIVEPHRHYTIGDGSPEFGPPEAWKVLLQAGAVEGEAVGGEAEAIDAAQYWLAEFVTDLLADLDVRPSLLWGFGEQGSCRLTLWPRFYIGGQIFGRIALMMSGTMGIAPCSAPGCSNMLRITGPRSPNKNAWCDEHKRTAAMTAAVRRYRARKAASNTRKAAKKRRH